MSSKKTFQTQKLRTLRDKLLQLKKFKEENRLFFMEWEKYQTQNDMREQILKRLETREGPSIFVVFGANRSGKSELGGGVVSEVAVNKNNRFGKNLRVICATIADIAVKVQQRKVSEIMPRSELTYGDYNSIRGWINRIILTKSKSTVMFKTYDQGEDTFQGEDVDLIWLDEECAFAIYSEAVMRIGDRCGVIVLTFTSLKGFTRLVNLLWETPNKNVKTCVLTAKENPFLSKQAKKQLYESIDPDELESRWEGKPHIKTGLIYKIFGPIHKIPEFDYVAVWKSNPDRYQVTEGIDPHDRTPHHWLRFLYDTQDDILYVVDELKAPKESMLIGDYSRLIKVKRRKIIPAWTQIDTSSQKPVPILRQKDEYQEDVFTIRKEFTENGIDTILCVKDNAVGINAVKHRLKYVKAPASGIIKRPPKIYVFNTCVGFIWEIGRYSWADYSTSIAQEKNEQLNAPKKKDDHFMDILKYECIKRRPSIIENEPQEHLELYEGMGY